MFNMREAESPEDTRDHHAVVKLLLDHGANLNNTTTGSPSWISSLMVAARCSNLEIAKTLLLDLLLEYLADVEFEDSTGETQMFGFIDGKNNDLIRELCKRGAKVNHQNFDGESALHVRLSSEETFKALLESGAQVDVPNHSGRTPLSYHIVYLSSNNFSLMEQIQASPTFSETDL
ncbi:hypothetical protein PENNAL_c0007G11300 [Penicillium nalgiovense]|uniref:Uncharacterized protein n=1 Tax=Penicillium nalgiovense TaxID=60175 RepID=A0A1V6YYE4_PENNA|nr:hypothetical protein PENNAL_c0007G11300 [Penicillium nalgiovense]